MEYITIDKTTKKAIYLQIATSIKEAIISGRLVNMDKLPTENELCEFFQISDIVVKRAYTELVKEGLVKRIQGSGTYISTRKTYRFPINQLNHHLDSQAFNYSSQYRKVILFDLLKNDKNIAYALQISEDEPIYIAKVLNYIDKSPFSLETIYLPKNLYPYLNIEAIKSQKLRDLINHQYQYTLDHTKSTFYPVNLKTSDSTMLALLKNAAAHLIRTTLYQNKQPIAFVEVLLPGTYTELEVNLG